LYCIVILAVKHGGGCGVTGEKTIDAKVEIEGAHIVPKGSGYSHYVDLVIQGGTVVASDHYSGQVQGVYKLEDVQIHGGAVKK
jgi:hypothetical protein